MKTTRIATIQVHGKPATRSTQSAARIELLSESIEELIRNCKKRVDAVLLPGGFFHGAAHIGRLPFRERRQALAKEEFASGVHGVWKELNKHSKGVKLIFGVDTSTDIQDRSKLGDQLAVGWGEDKVEALARKIFPGNEEGRFLHCYASDFISTERYMRLPSGRTAALCACYDMFGVHELEPGRSIRTRAIRLIVDDNGTTIDPNVTKKVRSELITAFQENLRRKKVSVALACIHHFELSGRDGYWFRHGIATAAAAIDGFAAGAAHYSITLPSVGRGFMAASDIPRKYLNEGISRAPAPHEAVVESQLGDKALVRVFEWGA